MKILKYQPKASMLKIYQFANICQSSLFSHYFNFYSPIKFKYKESALKYSKCFRRSPSLCLCVSDAVCRFDVPVNLVWILQINNDEFILRCMRAETLY